MVYHKEEIEAANERAAARLSRTPTATAAHYDRDLGRVVIDLSSGLAKSFGRVPWFTPMDGSTTRQSWGECKVWRQDRSLTRERQAWRAAKERSQDSPTCYMLTLSTKSANQRLIARE